jgi:hypothetical protein
MTIRMSNLERLTLAEMEEVVATSRQVIWSAVEPGSVYKLIERVLKAQQYRRLSKGQRGVVRRFLAKITALSRAQLPVLQRSKPATAIEALSAIRGHTVTEAQALKEGHRENEQEDFLRHTAEYLDMPNRARFAYLTSTIAIDERDVDDALNRLLALWPAIPRVLPYGAVGEFIGMVRRPHAGAPVPPPMLQESRRREKVAKGQQAAPISRQ